MTLERAVQALQSAQWERAISFCDAVLSDNSRDANAHHLRGIALSEAGQLLSAIEPLREAIACAPENATFHSSLALTWRKLGDQEQAIAGYARALQLQPDQPQWLYQLGLARAELGQVKRATRALKQALQLQPALVGAAAALARLYESAGDLQLAEKAAAATLSLDPANSSARITQADVLLRRGEAGALSRLRALSEDVSVPAADRAIAYAKLGKQLDLQEDYSEAWAAFAAGNKLLLATAATVAPSVYGVSHIAWLQNHFARGTWRNWPSKMPDGAPAPVFLVGFPRSGTTLLERMLSMHPRVSQLDEKETLREALHLAASEDRELDQWQDQRVSQLRQGYWQNLDRHLGRKRRADEVVIDKLPLNSLHLELIYRLFPEATILFAVRDPRDVCLSCFMQSFGLNDAMANFLSIETTVEYYLQVMNLALRLKSQLPFPEVEVRYELLVDDPEAQLRPVLEKLGLDWVPEILDYHVNTRGDIINTPSYQQVAIPLYGSSVGRWKKYRVQVERAFEPLQPLIRELGYQ